MNSLRIASFLPSATEMVCALGLVDHLVGVSHECDYPPEVKGKPVVVKCAMDLASLNLDQIDKAVSERVGQGGSVYAVDEAEIHKAAPTLIITQDLCQVCAPSGNEATQVLKSMNPKPEILWQTPHSFEDVLKDLVTLGEKTDTADRAEKLVEEMRQRVAQVSSITAKLYPVKVFFLEWVDPVYCGGHWVPQMLQWAGGVDGISRSGVDSVRIPWEEVTGFNPEVLIVSPCGFNTKDALKQGELLKSRPGWASLSAVKTGKVYAVDANAYFAKPGPRLADGVELLAHLIHPELFSWQGPAGAFAKI
jgi:iron complex transport system substrate-binding protein